MVEESLPVETIRAPELLSRKVLETRSGGVEAMRLLLKASFGTDFTVSHFAPGSEAIPRRPARSLEPVGERIPCSRFRGALPLASNGFMGTIPRVLLLRTKTAVAGRYTGRGAWTPPGE